MSEGPRSKDVQGRDSLTRRHQTVKTLAAWGENDGHLSSDIERYRLVLDAPAHAARSNPAANPIVDDGSVE